MYMDKHTSLFEKAKPLNKTTFQIQPDTDMWILPTASAKANVAPCMSRQSVWQAINRARPVMYALLGKRRWNPATIFRGQRVT
eukprot:2932010-Amphidinium_carterae.1